MAGLRLPARLYLRCMVRHQHTAASENPGSATQNVLPFEDIPGPKGIYNIPYLGSALHFKPFSSITPSSMHELLRKFTDEYGDIMKFLAGNSWVVVLSNPALSEQVLRDSDKYPFRPIIDMLDVYYKRRNLSPGLAVLQGEEWANLRRPANNQMLRPTAVSSYLSSLTPVADDFVAMYKNSQRIDDCLKTMLNFTTESVGMLCFNERLGCLDGTANLDFVEDLGYFFEGINSANRPFNMYTYFRTPFYNKFEKAADNLYRVASKEMHNALDKMDHLEKEGKLEDYLKEPNFLHALMSHPGMTPAKAQSLILDLFVGGIESTSNALTFLWHELAMHQNVQQRLYQEINEVIGNKNLDVEALAKMPYLKACVKESLRKNYPLSIGNVKWAKEDVVIGGYRVPKNTMFFVTMRNMCHEERFFKNPDQFIPERFLRGDKSIDEDTRHTDPFVYLPFGFGPRSCIGQRFAENEMYIITTKLFQTYKVKLAPEVPRELEYTYRIFANPTTKVNLLLEDRQ